MTALEYHELTKHHFNRFARSAGYLDWASQPDPFRRFRDAPILTLPRDAVAADVPYHALYDRSAPALSMGAATVSEFLRCAMGLSAWKQYQASRWALRVNPSSGNLHPTETYIVWNERVYHYAPLEHALEERCAFQNDKGDFRPSYRLVVGLTSIFWREAWKYGERAFRYCQHDLGHALAALRLSAARLGWEMQLLTDWSDAQVAALLGIDRDEDFGDAEREEAECLALVSIPGDAGMATSARGARVPGEDPFDLLESARRAQWSGRANRLSPSRVEWTTIDRVAEATRYAGRAGRIALGPVQEGRIPADPGRAGHSPLDPANPQPSAHTARTIILQRRSAVAFDGRSTLPADAFARMLSRLRPGRPPWDVVAWSPHVHLALFVHRVDGLAPGIYAFLRDPATATEWRAAMRPQFMWERHHDPSGHLRDGELYFLLPFDMIWPAMRVSCDQDIAGDGFFSLAMVGRTGSVREPADEWFYRRLFWESGVIGQVLYVEAEAAGARATGIGCFYDDAVHELLGLSAAADSDQVGATADATVSDLNATRLEWQSLYHFSMGKPVDDTRLTTEPGYVWERALDR